MNQKLQSKLSSAAKELVVLNGGNETVITASLSGSTKTMAFKKQFKNKS